MPRDQQRPLPGLGVERPTLFIPPAGSKPVKSPCAFCGDPSTLLCDYALGESSVRLEAVYTCDAPMCERCSKRQGSFIACSRGRHGSGCHHDTIDYCPLHANQPTRPRTILTAQEAERIRGELWGPLLRKP